MRNTMSKAIIAGLAALTIGASALATADPASAAWRGGGRTGGGWHGGGWHGGRGGYYGGGGWWGPAVVGGLAAGALLAAPYAYGYGYGYPYGGYGGGCYSYQPMYDAYGNYIGQQPVQAC